MARDYGYIISPSLVWYDFVPSTTKTGQFTFINSFTTNAPKEQTFVAMVKFVYQKDGKNLIYDSVPAELAPYSMNSWITLSKTEFTVKQNESVTIPYTITVPNNPAPGGKYAAIYITKKSNLLAATSQTQAADLQTSGAVVADSIAYEIMGKIKGQEIRNSETDSFTVNKPIFWWWPNEKAVFTLTFTNNGNIEYLPSGDVFVHNGDITQAFWNAGFNPDQLVILPNNTKSYSVTWEPTGGPFKTTPNGITINLDYFRIGKYMATAKVGEDHNGQRVVVDRVVSFWILPLPVIIAILTVILVTIIGRWLAQRNRQNHKRTA